jgi:hypothetical protein
MDQDNVPETELLSAYLDGELTAAEQTRAEQLLASNPAARQWVEDMRALSHTLHALPRQTLGEDLGPRVLRLAEQRMLAGAPPAQGAAEPPRPLWRETLRGMLSRRALVWSGLAVAIAVMMMLSEQSKTKLPARHVAQTGTAAPAKDAAPAAKEFDKKIENEELADGSRRDAETRKKSESAVAMREGTKRELVIQAAPRPATRPASKADTGVAMAEKKAPAMKPAAEKAPQPPEEPPADKLAKDGRFPSPLVSPSPAAPPPNAGATLTENGSGSGPSGGMPFAGDSEQNVVPSAAGQASTTGRYYNNFANAGGEGGAHIRSKGPGGQHGEVAAAAESPLVVQCDVTAAAVGQQTFDKLLVANGIARMPASNMQLAQNAAGPLDLVYVQATPAQIWNVLSQLAARQDAFPLVVVEPATGVAWQQGFDQVNRRGGQQQPLGPQYAVSGRVAPLPRPNMNMKKGAAKVGSGETSPPNDLNARGGQQAYVQPYDRSVNNFNYVAGPDASRQQPPAAQQAAGGRAEQKRALDEAQTAPPAAVAQQPSPLQFSRQKPAAAHYGQPRPTPQPKQAGSPQNQRAAAYRVLFVLRRVAQPLPAARAVEQAGQTQQAEPSQALQNAAAAPAAAPAVPPPAASAPPQQVPSK